MECIFGIFLCSHGSLAEGMLEAAEMISGECQFIQSFNFTSTDEFDHYRQRLEDQRKQWGNNISQLVCLCDLKGATPYNACAISFALDNTILVAGMNLPFLLSLIQLRDENKEAKEAVDTILSNSEIFIEALECSVLFKELKEVTDD